MICFTVSIFGFVCTTTSEFSAINIVGSMALASYRDFPTIFWSFFYYFRPIIPLVISLIASYCYFCRGVVSRGVVNLVVFLVSCVGMNGVMHVHILLLLVGPCLLRGPTLMLYQFKISLLNLWLLCTYTSVLISGVGHALFPNILPQIIY